MIIIERKDNVKTKEEIIKILMEQLNYAYCDNCKDNIDGENCDDCHRKYINWSLAEHEAERIANMILK